MRNKVLLKIAGIYAIVVGIFACLTIIGAIVGVPMIIGGNKFLKFYEMNEGELESHRDNLLGWSIFFIFFGALTGILGLVFYMIMDQRDARTVVYADPKEELERLKSLYDDHLITKAEYDEKKKKILGL